MRKAAGAQKSSALQRTEARTRLHSSPDKTLVSLSDAAYEAIKQRILSLALRPGLFVNEQTLSDMVGISRMPVHQAVQRLKADGLLDVIARKGIVIRMTSFKELLAIFEARSILVSGIV